MGAFLGGWGKIIGFLGQTKLGQSRRASDAAPESVTQAGSPEWTQLWSVSCVALVALFFGGIFYLRHAGVSGSPQVYLYLEVGGTLISFCYAANALVRFRGTHDRTTLILSFGFVLTGIIETIGYFGLNDQLQSGHVPLQSIPMGWMVSRTLLGVMLLAAILVERYLPTARQPSREGALRRNRGPPG